MGTKTLIVASMVFLGVGASSTISGPCAVDIEALTKAMASKDAGSGPTVGAAAAAQGPTRSGQHPPTAVMGQETQGKATSSEDVRRQMQGEPTAAQQGVAGKGSSTSKLEAADQALQRARTLDAAGKDAECNEAVREARELIGAK